VAGQPPLFPPGTSWRYSNTGYVLLGLMVEATTGRIFEPLGLARTYLPNDSARFAGPRARGYSLPQDPDGRVLDGPLLDITVQCPSWAWAAGALVSTLDDLGRFLGALTGGRLLPPALLADARSVVSHHLSPPVLPVHRNPYWSWSTAMLLRQVGHPSLPVTRGLVAMWSQFLAVVARLGVW
jgi:CubicO group peptidase (beta-lactamase class C family)